MNCILLEGLSGSHALRTKNIRRVKPFTGRICATVLDKDGLIPRFRVSFEIEST